jgi:putative copper resistance protein D
MAQQLLDIFGFLSVLLRGAALALNSLVLGGAGFLAIVQPDGAARAAVRRLILWTALALALVQSLYVAANATILGETAGLRLDELVGANFFVAGAAAVCAAAVLALLAARRKGGRDWELLAPAFIAWSAMVVTSHAAGRLEYRGGLILLTALHQGATAIWIGGLPYLLIALRRCGDDSAAARLCRRFSYLAATTVGVLAGSGLILSRVYVGSMAAVYGTSYGAMVAAKVVLLAMILCLGALNFLIVRRQTPASVRLLANLRRFAEAEIGIGFTVILAAASLTSQPPAVDLPTGPVRASEIVQRMRPQWPLLTTPDLSALSPPTPLRFDRTADTGLLSYIPGTSSHPNTPGDIAWSEYNHHWAGLIVLAAGLLALTARWERARWARHWPLAFLALAVFLFLRSDPENWPLGPRSFWQSFAVADVLQHRVFVLLVVAFAGFEWGVRTGRIASRRASFVFPAICAVGGALLLTHTHALSNINEELLIELSHLPLALCAVAAGWSRWLELRLAGAQRQIPAWIWPLCFIFIGAVLLNYREA